VTTGTARSESGTPRGVAAAVVDQAPKRGSEHQRLQTIIGKWINRGHTVAGPGAPAVDILTSDVYEWMPGGFFVLHTAYGLIGDIGVGGTEIIGYDPASQSYFGTFYDSQGNILHEKLEIEGNTWRWLGERTRATGTLSDDGMTMPVLHERSADGVNWTPSMEIVLTKVA
jgi:hypothetical protein